MEEERAEPLDSLDAEKEFREQQRSGLGATDTPKILGLSRYGTARTVYEKKIAEPEDDPPRSSLPAWVGLSIQGTVAELYSAATGYKVRAARKHYRHKDDDWVVCHLDYRVWGSPFIIVEVKTRSRMDGWGPDGTQDIPKDVYAQAQHEMLVMGAQECHVAVLFGHHTFRVYPIQRNEPFIARLRIILRDFWHDNVLAQVPPPLGGSSIDAAIAQRDHPEHDSMYRTATATQTALVEELRQADMAAKQAKEHLEGVKNRVKDVIGGALGLIGPFGKVTWRKTRDYEVVEWQPVAEAYRKVIESVPSLASEYDLDTLQSIYTSIREGSRRFTMDWEEG